MTTTNRNWLADGSAAALLGALVTVPCAAADAPTGQLEEIVVTAQKRDERLIDVPLSVTALASDGLQDRGALRFEDYIAYVPGLSATALAPGYSQVTVRGVTTGINQLSATTGFYIDETPTNSSTSTALGNRITPDPDLLDIARIEVLRGPQGTLYGANALGGVVRYVLREPDLTSFHGEAQVGALAVDHGAVGPVVRGALNAPILAGTLAVRLSGFYTADPGYIDNVASGRKDVNKSTNAGGRLAVKWAPNERFSANFTSLYQKRKNNAFGTETVNNATRQPTDGDYRQNIYTDEFTDTKYSLNSLKLDWDVGFGNLVSVTSYGHQETSLSADISGLFGPLLGVPGVALPTGVDVKKFTQELRLASRPGGRVDYIVGAFYTHEDADTQNGATAYVARGVPAPAPINPLLDTPLLGSYRETALFANATLNPTDRFNVQVGGRWSHNEQNFTEALGGLLFGPLSGQTFTGRSSESATTFTVAPQYKITPDAVLYARVAKGFRPGGTNLVPPGGQGLVKPTYDSDSLLNYELGAKAATLGGRLNLALAAFYIDWKDIQTTASAGGFNYLLNAGKARSEGLEGEARWSSNGLTLGANLSYTDATTRDAIPAVGAQAGDPLPYVPRWAGALTADQDFALRDGVVASVGGSVRHTGSQHPYYSLATGTNPAGLTLDSYTLVDLRAGLRWQRYDVRLFVENLLDKHALLNLQTETANPLTGEGARATVARPRTIGLTLGMQF
jgi:outer membrane receptor protein involved in Fe transport